MSLDESNWLLDAVTGMNKVSKDGESKKILPSNNMDNTAVESNLKTFYNRLEALGVNTVELIPILESKDTTLILSGAGSGKTTALILKIIHDMISGELLTSKTVNTSSGVRTIQVPANILVATFLKSGATELSVALQDWCTKLGILGIDYSAIHFKTLHAEVKSALEQMGVRVTILEDTTSLVRAVMTKYNVRLASAYGKSATLEEINDVAGILTYARNRLDDGKYEHPLMQEYNITPIMLDAIMNDFALFRRATNKYDFEDMQEMLLEALRINPNVASFIEKRYEFIFVDEFQDTSQLQYEILKYYFSGCKRIITVGDNDQCLTEDTLVSTPNGVKKISNVVVGDKVLSGLGRGSSNYFAVDYVSKKKFSGDLVVVKTESGKVLKGTPNHIFFARSENVSSTQEDDTITLTMFGGNNEGKHGVINSTLKATADNVTSNSGKYVFHGHTESDLESQIKSLSNTIRNGNRVANSLNVVSRVRFDDIDYESVAMEDLRVGMILPIQSESNLVVEEKAVSIEREPYCGYVYDLSVPFVRNYSANGIFVHNCIYSWRGSDNAIIETKFAEEYNPTILPLTTNYRCKSNILNPVISSIHKNTSAMKKNLKSYVTGGEVNVIYDGDVNNLVDLMVSDLSKGSKVGVLARVNSDLLIPAILLELDGTIDYGLSKSVSMNSRMARQVFGAIDLVTKRYTDEFESLLRMFVPFRVKYEVDKLCSVLKINKYKTIYTLPLEDLRASIPNLFGVIYGLRKAKEIGGVEAYLYLLDTMQKSVFVGGSIYSKKASDLVSFVKKLVLEHKDLYNKGIEGIGLLFNLILPSKLENRIKYGKGDIVKLSTVHEAKGKEWDSVYIWNDIKGVFPNVVGNRDLTKQELEEERRVHYIAWTRAKNKLTVFTTKGLEGTFLQECSLEGVKDSENIANTKTQVFKTAKKVKMEDVSTRIRTYISYVMNTDPFDSPRIKNIEVALDTYEVDDLAENLVSEYVDIYDSTEDEFNEILDNFFTGVAVSVE